MTFVNSLRASMLLMMIQSLPFTVFTTSNTRSCCKTTQQVLCRLPVPLVPAMGHVACSDSTRQQHCCASRHPSQSTSVRWTPSAQPQCLLHTPPRLRQRQSDAVRTDVLITSAPGHGPA